MTTVVGIITSRDGSDTVYDIERLGFSDRSVAYDVNGNGGEAFRIYQAALNRTSNIAGLGYWSFRLESGLSLKSVAEGFIGSAKFTGLYGLSPTNAALVDNLYRNVLHRAGEVGGVNYRNQQLNSVVSRAVVLVGFSERAENKASIIGSI